MIERIILTLMLLALFVSGLFARELVIAGIFQEPCRYVDKNGKLAGLDIDIIDYIMKKNNILYKIDLVESSARLVGEWEKDEPKWDMVISLSKNVEREKFLVYLESHINYNWNFFVLKENASKYRFESYSDLKNARIGITKGMAYSEEFKDAVEKEVFKVDEVVKNELQMDKLLGKRVDLIPMNTKATLYEAKMNGFSDKITYLPKPIKDAPYYNVFIRKSSYTELDSVMKKYCETLIQMKKDGTLRMILAKYGMDK